eukprot:1796461-Rhodomonas_salina.2
MKQIHHRFLGSRVPGYPAPGYGRIADSGSSHGSESWMGYKISGTRVPVLLLLPRERIRERERLTD